MMSQLQTDMWSNVKEALCPHPGFQMQELLVLPDSGSGTVISTCTAWWGNDSTQGILQKNQISGFPSHVSIAAFQDVQHIMQGYICCYGEGKLLYKEKFQARRVK